MAGQQRGTATGWLKMQCCGCTVFCGWHAILICANAGHLCAILHAYIEPIIAHWKIDFYEGTYSTNMIWFNLAWFCLGMNTYVPLKGLWVLSVSHSPGDYARNICCKRPLGQGASCWYALIWNHLYFHLLLSIRYVHNVSPWTQIVQLLPAVLFKAAMVDADRNAFAGYWIRLVSAHAWALEVHEAQTWCTNLVVTISRLWQRLLVQNGIWVLGWRPVPSSVPFRFFNCFFFAHVCNSSVGHSHTVYKFSRAIEVCVRLSDTAMSVFSIAFR